MSFVALAGTIGAGAAGLLGLEAGGLAATMIGGAGAGMLGGAGLGAATSALTGGDVGKGALMGALGGGLTGGIGSAIGGGVGTAAGSATEAVAAPTGTTAAGLAPGAAGGSTLGSSSGAIGSTLSPSTVLGEGSLLANPSAAAFPTSNLVSNAGQVGQVLGSTPSATGGALMNTGAATGNFFAQHPLMTIGAGSMLGSYLGGSGDPTQATPPGQPYNPLKWYKFDPRTFQAQPPGYLGYAEGGIASLASPAKPASDSVDFMGGDMFPTSQQNKSFYATPSQMPTSAQQAMASYEPKTNPLTGEETVGMASGGIADLGRYSDGGRLTRGPGDGMSDDIPANIAGKQPARLADGEFVVPADVVSHLGNGSTDAGAKHLYAMLDKVRKARTGRRAQGNQINPRQMMPA